MASALFAPAVDRLDAYREALVRGWSPDNIRPRETARSQLDAIAADAAAFVATLDDRERPGAPVTLPDGSRAPRLPGFHRWLWDDAFCGSISLRWQPGTSALPPHVLGHIGFSVVPWKRRRGYATQALALILPEARARGLDHVELTTDIDNEASQKVIVANGGTLLERFRLPAAYGRDEGLRFRIDL